MMPFNVLEQAQSPTAPREALGYGDEGLTSGPVFGESGSTSSEAKVSARVQHTRGRLVILLRQIEED